MDTWYDNESLQWYDTDFFEENQQYLILTEEGFYKNLGDKFLVNKILSYLFEDYMIEEAKDMIEEYKSYYGPGYFN